MNEFKGGKKKTQNGTISWSGMKDTSLIILIKRT